MSNEFIRRCKVQSVLIFTILALGMGFSFAAEKENNKTALNLSEKNNLTVARTPFPKKEGWVRWDGIFNLDSVTEVAQAHYYGYLDVFRLGVELEPVPPSCQTLFSVKVADPAQRKGLFGIRIRFPEKMSLEKGYEYKFYFKFPVGMEPDYVVIGDKKVWDKKDGKYCTKTVVEQDPEWAEYGADITTLYTEFNVTYSNIDRDEKYLWLVKDLSRNSGNTLSLWERGVAQYGYNRRPLPSSVVDLSYPVVKMPEDMKLYSLPPCQSMSSLTDYYNHPVKWDKAPVKKVDYPIADVRIICSPNTITADDSALLPSFRTPNSKRHCSLKEIPIPWYSWGAYLPEALKIYAESGGNGCYLRPKSKTERAMLPTMNESGMNTVLIEYPPISGRHRSVSITPEAAADLIGELEKTCPDLKKYFVLPEIEGHTFVSFKKWWEAIKDYPPKADVNLDNSNLMGKIQEALKAEKWWKEKTLAILEKKLGKKSIKDITWVHMAACAFFPQAYYYQSGAEMVIGKNIHRENINIEIANTRGNAEALRRKWGVESDQWFRTNVWTYHPDEQQLIYPSLFFSGPSIILLENAPIFTHNEKGVLGPNKCGAEILKFCRFLKAHPKRGKQVIKIAFMRGNAVDPFSTWKFWIRAFNDRSEKLTAVEKDWNLLDMFFYKWGRNSSTYSERLLTGTPFGPVNIISWNTSFDILKDYELVVFANNTNVMDEAQYNTLKKYVENGGILVMASSQLRRNEKEYYKTDVTDLFGVYLGERCEIEKDGRMLNYALLVPKDCNVLERFSNGDPLFVEKKTGKGTAYLFSSDYLTDEETAARQLIGKLAEKPRALEFSPFSGWLEYMVQKKGDIYIIPVINQGRGRFPSGNGIDHGEWKGKIIIDLDKLGLSGDLEAQKVEWNSDEDKFRLTPLILQEEGDNRLILNITVDKWCEILLGPKGKTERVFFFGEKD